MGFFSLFRLTSYKGLERVCNQVTIETVNSQLDRAFVLKVIVLLERTALELRELIGEDR